jgi:hypothetical protein
MAEGGKHSAKMAYAFTPPFELKLELEPKEGETRTYGRCTIPFARGEVLADGRDDVSLLAYVHRTDAASAEEAVQGVEVENWKVELEGGLKERFKVVQQLTSGLPGKERFFVRSERPVLYASREEPELTVKVTARAKLPLADGGTTTLELVGDTKVKPRLLHLTLWLLSGERPGTSEAVAYLCVAPDPQRPLSNVTLKLGTETEGTALLTVPVPLDTTGKDGIARWTLEYKGLTWDNVDRALFRVVCGLVTGESLDVPEATEVVTHVGGNLQQLLSELYHGRRSPALDLENPAFALDNASSVYKMVEFVIPDFVCGPATNLASWVSSRQERYTCGELAKRVNDWTTKRKFMPGPDDPRRYSVMNGIDYDSYWMIFVPVIHNFAGIYLAGMDKDDDPRFVDPWWNQAWDNPKYLSAGGLYTVGWERVSAAEAYAVLIPIVAVIAAKLIALAGFGMATAAMMVRTGLATLAVNETLSWDVSSEARGQGALGNEGGYTNYRRLWATDAVQWLRTNHPVLDPVQPIRSWPL